MRLRKQGETIILRISQFKLEFYPNFLLWILLQNYMNDIYKKMIKLYEWDFLIWYLCLTYWKFAKHSLLSNIILILNTTYFKFANCDSVSIEINKNNFATLAVSNPSFIRLSNDTITLYVSSCISLFCSPCRRIWKLFLVSVLFSFSGLSTIITYYLTHNNVTLW